MQSSEQRRPGFIVENDDDGDLGKRHRFVPENASFLQKPVFRKIYCSF